MNKSKIKKVGQEVIKIESIALAKLSKSLDKDFIKKRMPLKRLSSAEEIIPIIEFVLTPSSEILSGDLVADNCELNTFRN